MFESSANLAGAITFGPTIRVQTIHKNRGVESLITLLALKHLLQQPFIQQQMCGNAKSLCSYSCLDS
jgi:hypothetical protein